MLHLNRSTIKLRSAFTLIELLVVIAVIAILAIVVVLTLNPGQLLDQTRDANRVSDMQTITSALSYAAEQNAGASSSYLGVPDVIYISIPDPTATTTAGTNCAGIGLSGNYHCAASSTYRSTNGTGWIPVNFSALTTVSPLSNLPVDPVNTTSSGEYYQYITDGTSWEIASTPESQKFAAQSTSSFTGGTSSSLLSLGATTTDLTANTSFTMSGIVYNRITHIGNETATITDVGTNDDAGPLALVVSISTTSVTASGNNGTYEGLPYWNIAASSLPAGASTTVNISFSYPLGTAFSTTLYLYSGLN